MSSSPPARARVLAILAALTCAVATACALIVPVVADAATLLHAQSTVTRDTSAPVSATLDPAATSWQYQREVVGLAAGACGAWAGTWSNLGPADAAGTVSDTALADATCVRYRIVVDGTEVVTQVGELRVDRTAPVATIDPITADLHGTVTLSGTAADATTRVRSVGVMVEDRYSICPNAPLDARGRWTCAWTIGPDEVGPASILVSAIDAAGQRATASQAVTISKPPSPFGPREEDVDRRPPVVGLARMPLVSWTRGVRVKASAFDDRPGAIEVRVEQQSARVLAGVFSPWAPSYEEADVFPLERRGETTCFRGVAIDEAGNRAVSDPRCTTLPLDDIDLKSTGRWSRIIDRKAYLGGVRRATKPGAALTVRVADATPAIAVTKCRGCGAIKVFHGRRVVGTYRLAARTTQHRQLVQIPALRRPASQPLRIVAVNAKPVFIDGVVTSR